MEQTFKEYIKDREPKSRAQKKNFAGLKNEQQANDLWAYIKQFDENDSIKK